MNKTLGLFVLCGSILFLCAFANAIEERELQARFTGWMREHKRSYGSEEFLARWDQWRENAEFVERHNSDPTKTYKVAMNKYGDMSAVEFARVYTGLIRETNKDGAVKANKRCDDHDSSTNGTIPDSFDWRDQGAVTPVKNQGSCGDCYNFATTGSIEGAWQIAKGELISLSEQHLLDCANVNLGCNGGYISRTIGWAASNGGLNTEDDYPYTATVGACNPTSTLSSPITTYETVANGDEDDLLAKAAQGPVAVGVAAGGSGFQLYQSGVYQDASCTAAGIDHAVTLVGWGSDNGTPYWTLKNQWGTGWGEEGYMRIYRGSNQCGIASMAYRPVV